MPEVADGTGEGGGEAGDKISGGGGGAVVGDDNFFGRGGLFAKSSETKFQRADVIVGTDDEADFLRGDHEPSSLTLDSSTERCASGSRALPVARWTSSEAG